MRILFTGGSSFTGLWFVDALTVAGHSVTATVTKSLESYSDVRGQRVERLSKLASVVPEVSFGSPSFQEVLNSQGPFDLLCHHAATVTNYNSPDFDALAALRSNTANLQTTLQAFKSQGGCAVVLTGSVFEADEGIGDEPRVAFNPYGLSKTLTAQVFRHYVHAADLRLAKFVIPNPIGPWEEPRFTGYLFKTWKSGATAEVKTPNYVRDNIPVDLLAGCYVRFAEQAAATRSTFLRLNPSGFVERQGAFTERLAAAMRPRLQLQCKLTLGKQTDFTQPLCRANTDSAIAVVPSWSEESFWDEYAAYYSK